MKPVTCFSFGRAFILCVCLCYISSVDAACEYSMGVACPPDLDPQSFVNGLVVALNGGVGSEDPECPGVSHIYWDWGDGTVEEGLFPGIHEYVAPGDYEIFISATDDADVEVATTSCSLTVSEVFDGPDSIAMGFGAIAPGYSSVSMGYFASADGFATTSLGYGAYSTGWFGSALGFNARSLGDASTALGTFSQADKPWSIVLGSVGGVNNAFEYTDVAIGTTWPMAPLHVHRANGTAQILVEETIPEVGARTLFKLANPGNTKFEIMNTDAGNSWAFTNSGSDFRVSLQNSGVVEFRVDNFGDAYLAGVLNTNSDRNAKTNITPVDVDLILEKVAQLPIAEWAYKETPHLSHIGPMAQDFRAAFGTGSSDKALATMDTSGVALASIKALEVRNRQLEERVRQLESLVSELLPNTL